MKTRSANAIHFLRCKMYRRPARLGFTLLEMLTTVAALVIVLGLMLSLAHRVRAVAKAELTKDLLRRLDGLMTQYEAHNHHLPQVVPFIDPKNLDLQEDALLKAATENNRQALAALRLEVGASSDAFNGLPDRFYDESTLRDAWGMPIVYMAALHPAIGMAPQNRRFFFSAGPDRRFLSQQDNLYSYEEGSASSISPKSQPPLPDGSPTSRPRKNKGAD